MSSISIATLGMFDGPNIITNVGGAVIKKEEETIKPNIFVKNVEFRESLLYKNIQESFIKVKSVK